MKTDQFQEKEFEGDKDILFTFKGHGNSFCIMLNAKCIHSVKTLKAHNKKLNALIQERNLVEVI